MVLAAVGSKSCINGLFQSLQTLSDLNDVRTQNLHTRHIGSLLLNIHAAHVNITLQAEVSRSRCQCHTVLTGTGLRNDLLLAHVLGKERFAHTVVQFMGAGVVQILTLGIQLYIAQLIGQALQIGNRCGTALKFLADAAQFADEAAGFTNGLIGFVDFRHRILQFRANVCTAVRAKITVIVGIMLEIGLKIYVVQLHNRFPLCCYM